MVKDVSNNSYVQSPVINDYRQIKQFVQQQEKQVESLDNKLSFSALEAIPTFRRVASLPDKFESNDYLSALGLGALAVINLPEDLRDLKKATQQVNDKLLSILQSKVGRVIGGLKQIITKNQLSKSRKDAIQKTITYFENHRHMMDYATYLSKGYHIATGLVEGACGSFVKDRMEQSGMRWSIDGAQSILDMRAVKKNKDWNEFWQFYNKSETSHLYSDNYLYKNAV